MHKLYNLIVISLCFLLPIISFAATDDFTADSDITVEGVTFGETTADMLILDTSTAESFTFNGGTFTVTNPGTFKVGSSDSDVKSVIIKNSSGTDVACAENSTPGTSSVTLPTTSDTYTVTPSTTTVCTDLCTTLSNTATYNLFPTCGVATCNSGYTISGSGASATCIKIVGAGPVIYNPPTSASVVINGNVENTDSRNVTLILLANNVIQMAISNSESFVGISWEEFASTKQWVLSKEAGLKTVYVKFRSSVGDASEVVWDTINLTELGSSQKVSEITVGTKVITDGSLIRNSNAEGVAKFDIYVVKLINNKKFKRLILGPHVFESYRHFDKNGDGDNGWNDIVDVNQVTINAYTNSNLVRISGNTNVYRLTANGDVGAKQWLNMTVSAFGAANYDWDAIYEINAIDGSAYTTGNEITTHKGSTIVIQINSLRIRDLPSLNGNVVTGVNSGEVYNILEEKNNWYKINVGDVIGWCYAGRDNRYVTRQ